jgi:hypothetical protein
VSEIGRVGPASHPLVIGIEDDAVILGLPHAWWSLDAAQRDLFMRFWCEAERQAERNARCAGEPCQDHGNLPGEQCAAAPPGVTGGGPC